MQTKQTLTRAELARALRTVADRLEKNQGMPTHAEGLGYAVFIDAHDRLVIRVEPYEGASRRRVSAP